MPAVELRRGTTLDRPFLEAMLRVATFDDDPTVSIASVLKRPDLAMTIPDFTRPGDLAVVAVRSGVDVGAAWCRRFTDEEHSWGYVDDQTPEVGVAVAAGFRGRGAGTGLLRTLGEAARADGWTSLSLCTERRRAAAGGLYARLGFATVRTLADAPDSVVMRLNL